MIKLAYVFPALMFSASLLTIYIILRMWFDPQTLEYPKLAITFTVFGGFCSFYEFHRGRTMIKEIREIEELLKKYKDDL